MSQKFDKAQVFSSDFLVACTIFLLALVVIMIYWSYTNIQIEETRNFNDMVDKAYTISEAWFRDGTPEFWNSTNFRELGMLNDHKINETKMYEMKKIGYNKVKESIGAAPYEFYFWLYLIDDTPIKSPVAYLNGQSEEQLDMIYQLNESGFYWDFYESNTNVPSNLYITAKNHYLGSSKEMMKNITEKIDNYNSIILEHSLLRCPNLPNCDLTASERTILKNWVNNSEHTLFFIGQLPNFLNIFELAPSGATVNIAVVNSTDPVYKNAIIGSEINLQQNHEPFDNIAPPYPMKTIMYNKVASNKCIFCRWWYGNGTIYYIGDTSRDDLGPPIVIQGLKPFGTNFVFGKYPTKAQNIIKVQRAGILNNSIAIIEVLLWR